MFEREGIYFLLTVWRNLFEMLLCTIFFSRIFYVFLLNLLCTQYVCIVNLSAMALLNLIDQFRQRNSVMHFRNPRFYLQFCVNVSWKSHHSLIARRSEIFKLLHLSKLNKCGWSRDYYRSITFEC